MDFWTAVTILARRWRVLLAGAIATAAGLYGIVTVVPPTYVAEGEVLLILPAQLDAGTTDIGLQNPYLGFGGSLNVMAYVVARAVGGQEIGERIASSGADAEYVVDVPAGNAPMLSIETTSDDPEEAIATYEAVLTAVLDELSARQGQAGAPEQLQIVAAPVRTPIEAEKEQGSRLRAAAALLVLGGAITLGTAFLRESLVVRRARRVSGSPASHAETGDASEASHGESAPRTTAVPAPRRTKPPTSRDGASVPRRGHADVVRDRDLAGPPPEPGRERVRS